MKTVFLIDDDADDREIFQESLTADHPSVLYEEAENGAAAFEKLKSGSFPKPDLIFLDLNMPVMDGRAFLLQIKADPTFKDIPVIIYSTSSNAADKKFAEENQAAAFLTKQYSISLVRQDIQKAVKNFLEL
ncbi:response regulator [Flavobacterium hungaricum]|uniref:Response regulator n=1 Tax=Flavobacterium hungaricum TaxID=2082725 RepID=A0ABR9TND4_9FLAO|nr:response regulator [Flavobacterium hungaricum]MBE8726324.1 response regulator [Flavobacterium hungaricum]